MSEKIQYLKNCRSCTHLGSDDDGDEYSNNSWPVCNKKGRENVTNLKSFPFKKEQECFELDFWTVAGDPEISNLIKESYADEKGSLDPAFKKFREKYFNERTT